MTHRVSSGWSDAPASICSNDVLPERFRQLRKWGVQSHPDGTGGDMPLRHTDCNLDLRTSAQLANIFRAVCDRAFRMDRGTWRDILLEEVFEAVAETDERLREELVQVAAVCVAWIEDLDRRAFARVTETLPLGELDGAELVAA